MFNVFDSLMSKVLLGLAIILIAGFQYLYWFGEGGYQDHLQLTQKIQQQTEINNDLKERNRVLAAEVYDLKNGIEAIEEHARLDLGLIKPRETFIQMSTISTQYKPVYIDPNAQIDLRTNEDDEPETPPATP
ncbi:septum formation initiator family protein [Acinetobacter johnsonii]|jgi:cell division protein FtsB|uniref:Cell division protein FtsB n=3 Tax=Moraxellaceae TaxID=468 RepID=A0A1R7QCY2_ACIJO|nr:MULTISPECIES: septum formation initiator family protein [Acinetobacter]MDA0776001.1 septum formation initiator family protein [Pseudomonadota bacterium]NWK47777.1 septum formation initiator family protein [Acinetobacter sp. SwsAc7]NWK61290.1 septum formation initiator family protein [Acinetobacter sp. SwsAc3]ALV72623.1 cell division protein FtsB [Acinetobacter johnsonii XBB1]EEY95642.1 septum formation initiator [Acinetobacter johnsonii SH046]